MGRCPEEVRKRASERTRPFAHSPIRRDRSYSAPRSVRFRLEIGRNPRRDRSAQLPDVEIDILTYANRMALRQMRSLSAAFTGRSQRTASVTSAHFAEWPSDRATERGRTVLPTARPVGRCVESEVAHGRKR